ncbi:MAG TPA: OmpA family protein [Methylomirabilota bacterium]|nr:OmpA family protein [Methylomirabilota bacterium]
MNSGANRRFCYGLAGALALLLAGCSSARTFVVLLPEEDGASTAVSVGQGSRATVLDTPMTAATVDSGGNIEKATTTPEEVNQTFGAALAAQPPKPMSFTLYFPTGGTDLTPDSQAVLEALLAEVAKRQAVEVQVTGHTDRVGTEADNDRLSLERAQAVRDMLIQRGLKTSFIRAVGRGEREPLVPTPDEQPEPKNRRVEVIVR